jgi:hypothetical protein
MLLGSTQPASAGQLYVVLTRIFHTRHCLVWVAQATRLCRSATRRPNPGVTECPHETAGSPKDHRAFPPGQWPGGTGESPVPPRNYEICRLTRPRVWQSAPSPTACVHSIGSGQDAGMWSAGAPTTTCEAHVLPSKRFASLGRQVARCARAAAGGRLPKFSQGPPCRRR